MSYQGSLVLPSAYDTVDSVVSLLESLGFTARKQKENSRMCAMEAKPDGMHWIVNIFSDKNGAFTKIGLLDETYPAFYEFLGEFVDGLDFEPTKDTVVQGGASSLDEMRERYRKSQS